MYLQLPKQCRLSHPCCVAVYGMIAGLGSASADVPARIMLESVRLSLFNAGSLFDAFVYVANLSISDNLAANSVCRSNQPVCPPGNSTKGMPSLVASSTAQSARCALVVCRSTKLLICVSDKIPSLANYRAGRSGATAITSGRPFETTHRDESAQPPVAQIKSSPDQ